MTKRTQIIYSIISLCAVIAYCGFLVKNAITEVDTIEETLPHATSAPENEAFVFATESVTEALFAQADSVLSSAPAEEPSSPPTASPVFSPQMPAKGAVSAGFSLKHTYNSQTGDWRAHSGIDISGNTADPVFAIEDGSVTRLYTDPIWGNVIEIDHGEYISVYKNVSTLIMVKEGDSVTRGEKISGIGEKCAAESASPHLHFELLHYGKAVDPLILLG